MAALFSLTLYSQEGENNPQKSFEFGIGLEINRNNIFLEGSGISSLSISENFGFGTSILTKYNISKRTSILLESIIVFRDNNLLFTDINGELLEDGILFNELTIDVPLHISYLPFPALSLEPRVLAGPRYRYNIGNDSEALLAFSSHQFSFDVGVSVDFKIKDITLRPTFVYTRGLDNIQNENFRSISDTPFRMDSFSIKFLFFG